MDTFGRGPITGTPADNETVSASQVEYCEILSGGWSSTRIVNAVSELNDEASGGEGSLFEDVTIPFLGGH